MKKGNLYEIRLHEDLRKIHTEINNINIHRLVILAGALTLIGSTSQLFFKHCKTYPLNLYCEIFMLTSLFFLFWFDISIRNSQLKLVAFLCVSENSIWEKCNSNYINKYKAIQYPFIYVYIFLGIVVFLISNINSISTKFIPTSLVFIIYFFFISLCKWFNSNASEDMYRNWENILINKTPFSNDKRIVNIFNKVLFIPKRRISEKKKDIKILETTILDRYIIFK